MEHVDSVFLALGTVCRMFRKPLKQWWIPFFTVSGAHTTVCGATVLCLVATDASQRVVPMAVAFVRSESTAAWTWFLQKAAEAYPILLDEGVVIMSDGCDAINAAVRAELPRARRMFCLKHRLRNIARTFSASGYSDRLCSLFSRAATTHAPQVFDQTLAEIRDTCGAKAIKYVMQCPPNTWSNCHVGLLTGGALTSNDAGT